MTRVLLNLSAAAALCKRDFIMFTGYKLRLLGTLFTTAVSLTLFYYISRLVTSSRIGSPDRYYAFVVVGMVILAVLTSTLATPVATLRQELMTGTFDRMILAPFGPLRCVLSLMLFPLLVSLLTSVFTIAFASIAFGLRPQWPGSMAAIPVGLFAALSFAPFGLFMVAGVIAMKHGRSGSMLVITVLTVVSGVYFPVVLLPDWLRWLSDIQPFTPAVDLLRHLLVGVPLRGAPWLSVIKLVAFPAVLLPIALWTTKLAINLGARRGTLTEF